MDGIMFINLYSNKEKNISFNEYKYNIFYSY